MNLNVVGIVLLGILPTVVWLTFFSFQSKDRPTPFHMVIYGLILGAASTFVALIFEFYLHQRLYGLGFTTEHPLTITLFAAIEEVLKFLAVFLIIQPSKHFKEPLDAMIFMIIVGLGFAAVENVATLFNHGGAIDEIFASGKAFEIATLRFLGATLLHALVGAALGYHWAIGLLRKKAVGFHIIVGLLLAILLHGVFNYLIIKTGPISWTTVYLGAFMFFILIDFEEIKAADVSLPT